MFGSLFRHTLKQANRSGAFLTTPNKFFTTIGAYARKAGKSFYDPKVEELEKYVWDVEPEEVRAKYKNCSFEKDMLPALNLYKELGFNACQLRYLMKRKPSLLRLSPFEDQNDIKKLSTYLQDKFNMNNGQVRSVLLRNPWIINNTNEQLQAKIDFIQKTFDMTNKEIRRILIIYPTTFKLTEEQLLEKHKVLEHYLGLPTRTMGIICARFPYFLRNRTKYLRENIKTLLKRNFSSEQIISILKRHAEVFTVRPANLHENFHLPRRAGLHKRDTARIFTQNPRLLSIDATTLQPRKIKVLRRFGVPLPIILKMLRNNPRIFIKSSGSTFLKLKYLIQRMEMRLKTEPSFPTILNFSYAKVIRPRGELMLKKEKMIPWIEVLKLKDEEFVERVGATMAELNEIRNEFPEQNNELDYKLRFFSKWFSNSGKNAKY